MILPNGARSTPITNELDSLFGAQPPAPQPTPVAGTMLGAGIQPQPITTTAPRDPFAGSRSEGSPMHKEWLAANGGGGAQQPTAGNLGIQFNELQRTAPVGGVPQPGHIAGPGVDAQGLPTMGTAGGINDQLRAALNQMFGFNPEFQGVGPGSGQLGEDFGRARDLLGDSEFSPTFSDDYQRLFNQFTSQLERGGGVPNYNLPDRMQLAQGAIDRYNQAQAPIFQDQLRTVGSKAAALGRIGAGMTTNELTDVVTREGDARRRFAQDVMDDAIRGSAEDEYRKASLGLQGAGLRANSIAQLGGLDLDRAGLGQRAREFAAGGYMDLGRSALDEAFRGRNEARTERDTQFNQDLAIRDALSDAFGQGSDLSSRIFGQEQGIRGERRQLSRDAIQDNIDRVLLEDQLAGSEFDRALRRGDLLLGSSDVGGQDISDLLSLFL